MVSRFWELVADGQSVGVVCEVDIPRDFGERRLCVLYERILPGHCAVSDWKATV